MAVVVVIEVDPRSSRAAGPNPIRPQAEFLFGVVVPIPSDGAMKTDVDLVGRPDEFVRKPGSAAGTEDDTCFSERSLNFLIPPTLVSEFHNVSAARIELAHDRI